MKFLLMSSCLFLLLFGACKPAEEAQDLVKKGAETALSQPDRARVLSDLTRVTAALTTWKLDHDRYPETVAELGLQLNYPADIIYDARTGKVRSKTFPNL
jgi:hypothetical protein